MTESWTVDDGSAVAVPSAVVQPMLGARIDAGKQHDEYPDTDTVPVDRVLGIIEHIVATGSWPAGGHWVVDR